MAVVNTWADHQHKDEVEKEVTTAPEEVMSESISEVVRLSTVLILARPEEVGIIVNVNKYGQVPFSVLNTCVELVGSIKAFGKDINPVILSSTASLDGYKGLALHLSEENEITLACSPFNRVVKIAIDN